MITKRTPILFLFVSVLMAATGLLAAPDQVYEFSAQTSTGSFGEIEVRNKATITVNDLNWIRYSYKIKRGVTTVQAPDVVKALSFLQTSIGTGRAATTGAAGEASAKAAAVEKDAAAVEKDAVNAEREAKEAGAEAEKSELEAKALEDSNAVNEQTPEVESARTRANTARTRATQLATFAAAKRTLADRKSDEALRARTAANLALSILETVAKAETLQTDAAATIGALRSFLAASDKYAMSELERRGRELLALAEPWQSIQWPATGRLRQQLLLSELENKETYTAALDLVDKAKPEWHATVTQITQVANHLAAGLSRDTSLTETIRCADGPRQNIVSLVTFDLFPPEEADDEDQDSAEQVETGLVTLICSHPLSFSTGVFFSTLDEAVYDFRSQFNGLNDDGSPAASDVVGFSNTSNFRVLPGVLVNTRVVRLQNMDIHLSFGALADFGNDNGNDLEFITGPSFGFKKHFLATIGLHVGRVSELRGGFDLGTAKPEGLDAVPTQKAYKAGLGFGVSYNFRPK